MQTLFLKKGIMKNYIRKIFFMLLLSGTVFAQKYSSASSLWLTYQNTLSKADIISIDFQIDSSALYTYYAALNWNNGYAGVQRGGAGFFKHVHFSLWDPEGMTSSVIWHDYDVRVERFGGEGTGWKSMWNFHWDEHKPYRLLVKLFQHEKASDYDAWFFDFEKYKWKHLATFQYPIKKDFDYLMSFIEDFAGTAENYRAYSLFNPRQRSAADKKWSAFPFAEYYVNGSNPNCDGTVKNNKFKLETGGTINATNSSGAMLMIMPDEFIVSSPEIKEVFVEPNSTSGTLKVKWNYADNLWAPQESFRAIISGDSLFTDILHDSELRNLSDTSYIAVDFLLDTSKTYYLKLEVKSIFDERDEAVVSFRNYIVTDAGEETNTPEEYQLKQNYPNPFGKRSSGGVISTTIEFTLPENGYIDLSIYNILGEKIITVANGSYASGNYSISVDFENQRRNMTSGIYFYSLRTSKGTITKKMLFLK